jgi:hypothetical protein
VKSGGAGTRGFQRRHAYRTPSVVGGQIGEAILSLFLPRSVALGVGRRSVEWRIGFGCSTITR